MNNNQMDSETKKKIEENCLVPQNDEVTNTAKEISIFFFQRILTLFMRISNTRSIRHPFMRVKRVKLSLK